MNDMKKHVALILAQLSPEKKNPSSENPFESKGEEHEEGEEESMSSDDELHSIASELIAAVKHGDTAATVEALRAAFLCFDSEPHVEGEHVEETQEECDEEPEDESESYSHEVGERLGNPFAKRKKYASGGRAKIISGIVSNAMEDGKSWDSESYDKSQRPLARAILGG